MFLVYLFVGTLFLITSFAILVRRWPEAIGWWPAGAWLALLLGGLHWLFAVLWDAYGPQPQLPWGLTSQSFTTWQVLLTVLKVLLLGTVGAYCAAHLGVKPFLVPRTLPKGFLGSVGLGLAIAVAWVAWSWALFGTVPHEVSPDIDQGFVKEYRALVTLAVVIVAVAEEVEFRLVYQHVVGFLLASINVGVTTSYIIAVLAISALWTFGHTGVIDPNWVKFLQVLPLGLAVGFLYPRLRLEGCIVAHAAGNIYCALNPFNHIAS